ncbi:uncharacterized protein LOC122850647 [Aphidius gifuensis]|uniref:uncharacterized protein LOC122850647 n=1 Tax=Aphidius gifuensis TaxID=684658 RepID=UPI001CDBE33A|nr:uncharacterized protein LOC122850647 [Aphidius gifuensis]
MPLDIRDRFLCDAKLTIETPLKEKEDHFYKFDHLMASLDAFDALGDHETIVKPKKTTKPEFDEPGRVQLQFPMALSLQGFKQVIEIAPSNETFIIYHNVSFEAFKEPSKKNVIANTKNDKKTNIGRIEMLLQTGDLELTTQDPSNPSFDCRHEVSILVDLDGDVPLIEMNPKTIQKHTHR